MVVVVWLVVGFVCSRSRMRIFFFWLLLLFWVFDARSGQSGSRWSLNADQI